MTIPSFTPAPRPAPGHAPQSRRALPPGGGLVLAGAASILFWTMIAGIVVIA